MDINNIDKIIASYLDGSIQADDKQLLRQWLDESPENKRLFESLTNPEFVAAELSKLYQYDQEKAWQRLKEKYLFEKNGTSQSTTGSSPYDTINPVKEGNIGAPQDGIDGQLTTTTNHHRRNLSEATIPGAQLSTSGDSHPPPSDTGAPNIAITTTPRIGRRTWQWAAAILAGIIGTTAYLANQKPALQQQITTTSIHDINAPERPKAHIQLSNGQTVSLDSLNTGILAHQDNIDVLKDDNSEIVYKGASAAITYNTLVNPRGGTVVTLRLTDGTKVWLNSESSIRYPTVFSGPVRTVEIAGEAYFEVVKDGSKKIVITGNGSRIEVLGTHFNVNSYLDETSTKVTLLEGSVRVSNGTATNIIRPGEQALLPNSDKKITVTATDTEKAIAWKSGAFSFEDDELSAVLKQLGRWYDVHFIFDSSNIVQEKYSGIISRQLTLGKVLGILDLAGLNYTIEGKNITIHSSPK